MTTPLITRLEEAADMNCPKCNARSGDDWEQCKGSCPMPGSPYFESQPQGQAMTDTVRERLEKAEAVAAKIERKLAYIVGTHCGVATNDLRILLDAYFDQKDLLFECVAYGDPEIESRLAASPQGEGSSGEAHPAPIKPSGDTGEVRERVAREIRHWPFPINQHEGCLELADAILDIIQSERAG